MSERVLVTYASVWGATAGIAEAIGQELRRRGRPVDVQDVRTVKSLDEYAVVIVGSAIRRRRWQRSAVRFLYRYAVDLHRKLVWTFQSGPVVPGGDRPTSVPADVTRLLDSIGAIRPITFAGRLPSGAARGLHRRLLVGKQAGDYRDWVVIRAWADQVDELIGEIERWRRQELWS